MEWPIYIYIYIYIYGPVRETLREKVSHDCYYVPTRAYDVPIREPLLFERICYKVIRSYTFRATLSQFCEIVIRSYTFLLRSYT
jgi:hypothetical protein